jgi:hypothetical protein
MVRPRLLLERLVIGLALLIAFAYATDYVYLRVRLLHPKTNDPFETMTTPRILAISEKGNKVSYEIDELHPTQTLVCVHSLFPHYGNQPCWYVKKDFGQPIPMVVLIPALIR